MGEQVSRWLEPFTKTQPRAMLHGITVVSSKDEKGGEDLVIPHLGPLIELAQKNPDCWEFDWDANEEKWTCIRL